MAARGRPVAASAERIEVPADRYWGAQSQRSLGNFKIGWEKQPAAAGKTLDLQMAKIFSGWAYKSVTPKGDKIVRASPTASSAKMGKMMVLAGDWNDRFINELHMFPDDKHDDIVDATAGAHDMLNQTGRLLWW